MKDLDIDNPFFEFMGELADVAILNILFIVCSVPVVTMGASTAAMYETMRIMREGCLTSPAKTFLRSFAASFKKSVPSWLLQLFTGCILIFDLSFVGWAQDTWFWHVSAAVIGCLLLLWMMASCYLFPAAVYEGRSVRSAVSESLLLAARNLPYTIVMAVLNAVPGICIVLGTYFMGVVTPIYLTVGFGATAYLNTMLMERCRGMVNERS